MSGFSGKLWAQNTINRPQHALISLMMLRVTRAVKRKTTGSAGPFMLLGLAPSIGW